jgi:hypothetical protein
MSIFLDNRVNGAGLVHYGGVKERRRRDTGLKRVCSSPLLSPPTGLYRKQTHANWFTLRENDRPRPCCTLDGGQTRGIQCCTALHAVPPRRGNRRHRDLCDPGASARRHAGWWVSVRNIHILLHNMYPRTNVQRWLKVSRRTVTTTSRADAIARL